MNMVRTCRGVRIKDVCVTLANNMVHFDDASTTQWVGINSEGRFLFFGHMCIFFLQSCAKSRENCVFRPKMAIFRRAGMRKGGLPLPLAFQYLILMI